MDDDEGQQAPEGNDPPAPTGRTFTQEEFDKALQRERDKLYGRIEKGDEHTKAMQDELKELREAEARRSREEAKRQREAEAAAKRAEEAELSAKELIERRQAEWEATLADRENQWQAQVGDLQAKMAERDALFERERQFQALAEYARRQVAAHQDEIAPELIDFVGGNSQEEIDASVARVIEKTQAIVAGIRGAQTAQRAAMPGVSPAGFAPTGPLETQGGTKQLSPDEIAGMSMADYAKLRQQLGMGQQGRGLFG